MDKRIKKMIESYKSENNSDCENITEENNDLILQLKILENKVFLIEELSIEDKLNSLKICDENLERDIDLIKSYNLNITFKSLKDSTRKKFKEISCSIEDLISLMKSSSNKIEKFICKFNERLDLHIEEDYLHFKKINESINCLKEELIDKIKNTNEYVNTLFIKIESINCEINDININFNSKIDELNCDIIANYVKIMDKINNLEENFNSQILNINVSITNFQCNFDLLSLKFDTFTNENNLKLENLSYDLNSNFNHKINSYNEDFEVKFMVLKNSLNESNLNFDHKLDKLEHELNTKFGNISNEVKSNFDSFEFRLNELNYKVNSNYESILLEYNRFEKNYIKMIEDLENKFNHFTDSLEHKFTHFTDHYDSKIQKIMGIIDSIVEMNTDADKINELKYEIQNISSKIANYDYQFNEIEKKFKQIDEALFLSQNAAKHYFEKSQNVTIPNFDNYTIDLINQRIDLIDSRFCDLKYTNNESSENEKLSFLESEINNLKEKIYDILKCDNHESFEKLINERLHSLENNEYNERILYLENANYELKERLSSLERENCELSLSAKCVENIPVDEAVKLTFTADVYTGSSVVIPYCGNIRRVKIMLDNSEVPMSKTDGYLYYSASGKITILCGSNSIGYGFSCDKKITEKQSGTYSIFIY